MINSSLFYASFLLYTFPMWTYFEISEIHFFTDLEKNPPSTKGALCVWCICVCMCVCGVCVVCICVGGMCGVCAMCV